MTTPEEAPHGSQPHKKCKVIRSSSLTEVRNLKSLSVPHFRSEHERRPGLDSRTSYFDGESIAPGVPTFSESSRFPSGDFYPNVIAAGQMETTDTCTGTGDGSTSGATSVLGLGLAPVRTKSSCSVPIPECVKDEDQGQGCTIDRSGSGTTLNNWSMMTRLTPPVDLEAGCVNSRVKSFLAPGVRGDEPRHVSYSQIRAVDIMNALREDSSSMPNFQFRDNKFAFSPKQLRNLVNDKNLGAFYVFGGLSGLEAGLRTDMKAGLSVDETEIEGYLPFFNTTEAGSLPGSETGSNTLKHCSLDRISDQDSKTEIVNCPLSSEKGLVKSGESTGCSTRGAPSTAGKPFCDRIEVFSDNKLPGPGRKKIYQIAWSAYNEKSLILLTIAGVISLGLGLSESLTSKLESGGSKSLEWVEGVTIIFAIFVVVMISAVNNWQKERYYMKLRLKDQRRVRIIRSGRERYMNAVQLLVGDVVLLEPGDVAPVDGVLIDSYELYCDESGSTGESNLCAKTSGEEAYNAIKRADYSKPIDPFIIAGTRVVEGSGSFLVTGTGVNCTMASSLLYSSAKCEVESTPSQEKLIALAGNIAKFGVSIALFLFLILLIEFFCSPAARRVGSAKQQGRDFLSIIITTITVVVVAVPEGLPMAMTLAFAFATSRMLKDGNLVQSPRSCETVGQTTTICCDKTGTLTEKDMAVKVGFVERVAFTGFGDGQDGAPNPETEDVRGFQGKIKLPGYCSFKASDNSVDTREVARIQDLARELVQPARDLVVESIAINTSAFENGPEDECRFAGPQIEIALLNFARDYLGMDSVSVIRSNANKVHVYPFNSRRKLMATLVKLPDGKYRLYAKGASEILIEQCTRRIENCTDPAGITVGPLTRNDKEQITQAIRNYSVRCLNTIALVYRDFNTSDGPPGLNFDPQSGLLSAPDCESLLRDMVFVSVLGLENPVRDGVREAVKHCKRAGVMVRVITGENIVSARATAEQCEMLDPGMLIMEGETFRNLSRSQAMKILPRLVVLARSSPEDKKLVVRRLKELGETVAVAGAGSNDAAAMKEADVSFAMGVSGTEIVKQASSIILTNDDFNSIVKALLWGRAVNDSIRKFLQFQLTVNVTAVTLTFVSAIASHVQRPVLSAVQMLWVNLIMDIFGAVALAADRPAPSLIDRQPENNSGPLITPKLWKMIVGQSLFQLVVTLTLHFAGDRMFPGFSQLQVRTIVFNSFVWIQIVNEINCRRTDDGLNVFEGLAHERGLVIVLLLVIAGQTCIIWLGGPAFQVTRLSVVQWALCICLGTLSLPMGMLIRMIPDRFLCRLIPSRIRQRQARKLAWPKISTMDGANDESDPEGGGSVLRADHKSSGDQSVEVSPNHRASSVIDTERRCASGDPENLDEDLERLSQMTVKKFSLSTWCVDWPASEKSAHEDSSRPADLGSRGVKPVPMRAFWSGIRPKHVNGRGQSSPVWASMSNPEVLLDSFSRRTE